MPPPTILPPSLILRRLVSPAVHHGRICHNGVFHLFYSLLLSSAFYARTITTSKPTNKYAATISSHDSSLSSFQTLSRRSGVKSTVAPTTTVSITSGRRRRGFRGSSSTSSPIISPDRNVPTLPSSAREIHGLLDEIREIAAERVSLSRLLLAQRGLKSEVPIIRIAVLGLGDISIPRRLIRLLLADPLKPREQWEHLLDSYPVSGSQTILLRYGEGSAFSHSHLLPTLSIPSPLLKRENIEILVSTLGAGAEPLTARITAETFLVPTVTIPASGTGRHSSIRFPVHRSIICGNGVDGLLAYSRLISRANLDQGAYSICGVIELAIGQRTMPESGIFFVNTHQAERALMKFRESAGNFPGHEHEWAESGMDLVLDWLSTANRNENPKIALKRLIESLLDAAEQGVIAQEIRKRQEQEAASVPKETLLELEEEISAWAERAHTELRDSLEVGFTSPEWHGLSWWKLFWRADDVGIIATEILEKRYLPQAENEAIWTSGRFKQAGLLHLPKEEHRNPESCIEEEKTKKRPSSAKVRGESWPTQIATSRAQLAVSTVSPLQALSQNLVLFSMSTTVLTSALSVLVYVSASSTSVYEACTVVAVGLIYSLRRQQKKWAAARNFWEKEVRETGRMALKETEGLFRASIRDHGRSTTDGADESRRRARAVIERGRDALSRL